MHNLLDFLQTHEEAFRSRARLASLYSDFRLQRSTNPDGYAANSAAWLRALTSAARAGLLPLSRNGATQSSHLAFSSGNELASSLQSPQWGRPLALGAVIQDAVDKRELVPLQDFLSSSKSIYSKSWVPSPWQVVSWGLRQLGIGGHSGDDKLAVGNFVVMANVEAAGLAMLRKANQNSDSLTSRIYSRSLFETEFASILAESSDPKEASLSDTDMNILLTYLSRDKPILSYTSDTIKFAAPNTTPDTITQQDTTIANLKTLITSLTTQVDALTTKISGLQAAARTAITANKPLAAKSALRSKKLAETTLTTRSATLAQLEEVYTSIEAAATQVAIVRVMEASGSVLRSLHQQVGGVEGVEGVVDKLREEMENVDEVGRVINQDAVGSVDEAEVEDELEEMEKVEREKREAVERADQERKEAVDRAERKKVEEADAEKTRQRLLELGPVEQKREQDGQKMDVDVESSSEQQAAEPIAQ